MMKSYHKLETSTYENVRSKKLSRIYGKPTWHYKEDLLQEAGEMSLKCDVYYDWASKYGVLDMVMGGPWYLTESGFNYVKSV